MLLCYYLKQMANWTKACVRVRALLTLTVKSECTQYARNETEMEWGTCLPFEYRFVFDNICRVVFRLQIVSLFV